MPGAPHPISIVVEQESARLAELAPADSDPAEVARQIGRVVDLPEGERPFRVHVDPAHDGAEEVFDLGDRMRTHFHRRIGFDNLLRPTGAR